MHKIFKYDYDREMQRAILPTNAKILRVDHVDDGFYKGDFVWAIVDTNETEKVSVTIPVYWLHENLNPLHIYYRAEELKVKEKQEITIKGIPMSAGEGDGKIFVYYAGTEEEKTYKIGVFKTGQEIDVPVEKLRYLGLNRLWIVQELGLYTFLIED